MHGIPVRSGMFAASAGLVLSLVVPLGVLASAGAPASAATVAGSTSTTAARPASPTVLRQGVRGTSVPRWERLLRMQRVDTYFGPATTRAVKRVQAGAGLSRTGVIDARTGRAIVRWNRAVAKQAGVQKRLTAIVKAARKASGRPYARGASGPRAFDCSGYTRYVVRQALGRTLPHQSGSQASTVKRISRSAARPGDLVFFRSGGRVYHVGIYAGGGRLYHASRPGTRSGLGPIFSSKVTFGRVA